MPRDPKKLEPFQFKKGVSGNPSGRPAVPDDLKRATRLTQTEFLRKANQFIAMTAVELHATAKDPKTTALELLIISIIQKGVIEGDEKRLGFLLDRLIGKQIQHMVIDASIETTRNVNLSVLSVDELKTLERIAEKVSGPRITGPAEPPEEPSGEKPT